MHAARYTVCYWRQSGNTALLSFLVIPLMIDRECKQVTTLSFHTLEGPASNHGYWQTKGSIGRNGHSDKSSDSSTHLPFLPMCGTMTRTQPIAFTAHLIPSYWLSRSPAVHRVRSAVWMTRRCRGTEPLNVEELLWNPPGSFLYAQAV